MDRPEPVFCHSCRGELSFLELDEYVWHCRSCGGLTQVDAAGFSHPAESEVLVKINELKAEEQAYRDAIRPYLLPLGLKFQEPKWVPPDNPGIVLGGWFALLVLVGFGFVLLFLGLTLPGLLLACGGALLVVYSERGRMKKVAAYEKLTAAWEARRAALHKELQSLVWQKARD